jgi:hypothetical protein
MNIKQDEYLRWTQITYGCKTCVSLVTCDACSCTVRSLQILGIFVTALTMQDSIIESKTIYYTLFMVFCWCGNIFIEKKGEKDSKSYLDSKSTIFEVINIFRLYDRVCIVSALIGLALLMLLYSLITAQTPHVSRSTENRKFFRTSSVFQIHGVTLINLGLHEHCRPSASGLNPWLCFRLTSHAKSPLFQTQSMTPSSCRL